MFYFLWRKEVKMKKKFDKYFFDIKYKETEGTFWGLKPTPLIIEFEKMLKRNSKVLDLGCGEGRVALYLAEKGHTVTAIDISEDILILPQMINELK